MSRLRIVCATCQGTWPIQGTSTPYLEMQLGFVNPVLVARPTP